MFKRKISTKLNLTKDVNYVFLREKCYIKLYTFYVHHLNEQNMQIGV